MNFSELLFQPMKEQLRKDEPHSAKNNSEKYGRLQRGRAQVKRIVIILASVGVFGTRMTPLGMAGSGIAVAGAFLYALAKQFSAKPKKPQLREVPLLFFASSQQFPTNNSTGRISAFFYTLHFFKIIIMKILRGFPIIMESPLQ